MKVSMRLQRSILCGIFAALAIISAPVLAADFYVATDGNDGNPGTSALPFATIGAAITAADAAIVGGDTSATIHVFDGTYTENSLTLANPITVVGESGDRDAVIVDADKVGRTFTLNHASATLSGITVRNGMLTGTTVRGGNIYIDSNGGTVTNCVVANGVLTGMNSDFTNGGGNIYMNSASAMVADCIVTNGAVSGTRANAGNVFMENGRVTRCLLAKGSSSGSLGCGGNAVLRGSSVMDNCLITGGTLTGGDYGGGVVLRDTTTSRLVNCTIVGNTGTRAVSNKNNAKLVNCVIFGNGGTAQKEWGGDNAGGFINCAVAAAAKSGFTGSGCITTLTEVDFVDYANGDYAITAAGVLCDSAVDPSSYTSADCSMALNGVSRPSGSGWDIGAYEYDQNQIACSFSVDGQSVLNASDTTFTPIVSGISGTITYKWDFDDGGSEITTTEAPYIYRFSTAKQHHVTLSVSGDGGSTWKASYTPALPILSAPAHIWLDASNAAGATYPYDTEAKASTDLNSILGMLTNTVSGGATVLDGVTIHVKQGTYHGSDYLAIGSAVTIRGEGASRESVVFDAESAGRVFRLNHASATISGVTVANGAISDAAACGGNICIDSNGGVVTNCVVASGRLTGINNPASFTTGGGNIYMQSASALVVDSVVTNGYVSGTRACAGNIFVANGRVMRCVITNGSAYSTGVSCNGGNALVTGSGIIENCLITGGFASAGDACYGGAVCLRDDNGNARLVNCTIIGNSGTTGVYSKNGGKVVNCVMYGNGDTPAKEWGNANAASFLNCSVSANAAISGGTANIATLTDADFKDYAGGNYAPKSGGVLVDAGSNELYALYATSATDLAGNPRINKKIIDIGCYEIASSVGLSIFVR